jgi:hypothetical protein
MPLQEKQLHYYIVEYNYTSAVYTGGDPEMYFKYKCIYKNNNIEIIKV